MPRPRETPLRVQRELALQLAHLFAPSELPPRPVGFGEPATSPRTEAARLRERRAEVLKWLAATRTFPPAERMKDALALLEWGHAARLRLGYAAKRVSGRHGNGLPLGEDMADAEAFRAVAERIFGGGVDAVPLKPRGRTVVDAPEPLWASRSELRFLVAWSQHHSHLSGGDPLEDLADILARPEWAHRALAPPVPGHIADARSLEAALSIPASSPGPFFPVRAEPRAAETLAERAGIDDLAGRLMSWSVDVEAGPAAEDREKTGRAMLVVEDREQTGKSSALVLLSARVLQAPGWSVLYVHEVPREPAVRAAFFALAESERVLTLSDLSDPWSRAALTEHFDEVRSSARRLVVVCTKDEADAIPALAASRAHAVRLDERSSKPGAWNAACLWTRAPAWSKEELERFVQSMETRFGLPLDASARGLLVDRFHPDESVGVERKAAVLGLLRLFFLVLRARMGNAARGAGHVVSQEVSTVLGLLPREARVSAEAAVVDLVGRLVDAFPRDWGLFLRSVAEAVKLGLSPMDGCFPDVTLGAVWESIRAPTPWPATRDAMLTAGLLREAEPFGIEGLPAATPARRHFVAVRPEHLALLPHEPDRSRLLDGLAERARIEAAPVPRALVRSDAGAVLLGYGVREGDVELMRRGADLLVAGDEGGLAPLGRAARAFGLAAYAAWSAAAERGLDARHAALGVVLAAGGDGPGREAYAETTTASLVGRLLRPAPAAAEAATGESRKPRVEAIDALAEERLRVRLARFLSDGPSSDLRHSVFRRLFATLAASKEEALLHATIPTGTARKMGDEAAAWPTESVASLLEAGAAAGGAFADAARAFAEGWLAADAQPRFEEATWRIRERVRRALEGLDVAGGRDLAAATALVPEDATASWFTDGLAWLAEGTVTWREHRESRFRYVRAIDARFVAALVRVSLRPSAQIQYLLNSVGWFHPGEATRIARLVADASGAVEWKREPAGMHAYLLHNASAADAGAARAIAASMTGAPFEDLLPDPAAPPPSLAYERNARWKLGRLLVGVEKVLPGGTSRWPGADATAFARLAPLLSDEEREDLLLALAAFRPGDLAGLLKRLAPAGGVPDILRGAPAWGAWPRRGLLLAGGVEASVLPSPTPEDLEGVTRCELPLMLFGHAAAVEMGAPDVARHVRRALVGGVAPWGPVLVARGRLPTDVGAAAAFAREILTKPTAPVGTSTIDLLLVKAALRGAAPFPDGVKKDPEGNRAVQAAVHDRLLAVRVMGKAKDLVLGTAAYARRRAAYAQEVLEALRDGDTLDAWDTKLRPPAREEADPMRALLASAGAVRATEDAEGRVRFHLVAG